MKLKKHIQRFLHNEPLKRKLYIIIFEADTPAGKLFDVILIACIITSVLIVMIESMENLTPQMSQLFIVLEYIFTTFFTLEYLTRIYCSPHPKRYVSSFFGVIDLLSTLPLYLGFIFPAARHLVAIRVFRLIRVFRVFKLFGFLREGEMLLSAIYASMRKITVFFLFIVVLVIVMGTLMYMVEGSEPDTQFRNIPQSIYWAVVTMTTVGYGDITPVTAAGRFLSAFVMLLGYTIIAVPTGIVSVSMMQEQRRLDLKRCPACRKEGHEASARYCKYCGADLQDMRKAGSE